MPLLRTLAGALGILFFTTGLFSLGYVLLSLPTNSWTWKSTALVAVGAIPLFLVKGSDRLRYLRGAALYAGFLGFVMLAIEALGCLNPTRDCLLDSDWHKIALKLAWFAVLCLPGAISLYIERSHSKKAH